MTLRQRWKQTALHNKLSVILAGVTLIIAGLGLVAGIVLRNPGPQSGGSLLKVSPSVKDAHVLWDAGEFSLRPEKGNDPFAITVRNIGDSNAVDLTLRFVLTLDTERLIKTAQPNVTPVFQ
jgi:hypothetical protein